MRRSIPVLIYIFTLSLIPLSSQLGFSQVPTGTPQFGSFAKGTIDTINLATLNVHFEVPVRQTAGRNLPFAASISEDNNLWYPGYLNGVSTWLFAYPTLPGTPSPAFWPLRTGVIPGLPVPFSWSTVIGNQHGYCPVTTSSPIISIRSNVLTVVANNNFNVGQLLMFTGLINATFLNGLQVQVATATSTQFTANFTHADYGPTSDMGYASLATDQYTLQAYTDIHNTAHPAVVMTVDTQECNWHSPGSVTSLDGYITTATASPSTNSITVTVTDPSGIVLNSGEILRGVPQTASTQTDTNGNVTSVSGGLYTDSSGNQVLTAASPYSYTGPGSTPENVTVTYTRYNFQTNFACSGIGESVNQWSGSLPTTITMPDNSFYTIGYEQTPGHSTYTTGRISSITLPTGGTITYTYNGSNGGISCQDGGTSGFRKQTPDGTWTYSRAYNSSTKVWTTTVTDPLGNNTVYTFSGTQSSGPTTASYEVQRQVYQLVNGSQVLMKTQLTCYNTNFSNCATSAVVAPITQIDRYTSLPGVSGSSLSETKYATGLLTEDKEYDFGTAAPPTTNPISDRVLSYGTYNGSSCTALGSNIINRPCMDTTKDSTGTVLAQTTYQYDSRGNSTSVSRLVSGSTYLTTGSTPDPNTGLPTVVIDVNGAQTTYTYGTCNSSFPTNVAEPLSLSRSMAWDCTGEAPTQGNDENNQPTNYSYVDPTTSYLDPYYRIVAVTDPLMNITHWTYTPTSMEHSLLFNSNASTVDVLSTSDNQGRLRLTQTKESPSSPSFDTIVQGYDSDGRPATSGVPCVSSASNPCPSGTTSVTYDNLNRQSLVTDGGGGSVGYNYAPGGTYNNDILVTVGPQASGEHTKQRQLEYDGLGRLTSVCEMSTTLTGVGTCGQTTPQSGYWTRYKYDGLGRLIGVCENTTQSLTVDCVANPSTAQQTRKYSYDGLNRLTSETNPESGTTTYIYDSLAANYCGSSSAYNSSGDLVAKADANGNHICFRYDSLHRVTDVTNNAQSSTNSCQRFRYDQVSNGIVSQPSGYPSQPYISARLLEAETDNCVTPYTPITDEWFSYDQDGNITDMWEFTPHSTQYYHSKATFFATGKVNTIQLLSPSLYTLTYGLDGEGRWNTLTDTTASQNIVTGTTFFPSANPATITYTGSTPDNDAYTIDSNTGRMNKFVFTVGSTPETLTGNLTWNTNGTLGAVSTTDQFNPGNSYNCYSNSIGELGSGYDDLGRLIEFDCGSGNWGQQYAYDPYGNLTKTVLSGRSGTTWTPGYSSTNNHCNSCTYDADGNVLSDGNHVYTWNVFAKLNSVATSGSVTCGTNGKCAVYDAFGRMVESSSGSTWTEWWITQGGTVNMSGTTANQGSFPTPGGNTAIVSGSTYVLHNDWLGSARLAHVVSTRSVYVDRGFTPYGEIYSNYGGGDAQARLDLFAGTTDNLDRGVMWDTPNRELSIVGRWLSPDPAGLASADVTNPQSWNRYAYVLSNPLSNVDPSGLDCVYPPPNQDATSVGVDRGNCNNSLDNGNGIYVDCDGCLFDSSGNPYRFLLDYTSGSITFMDASGNYTGPTVQDVFDPMGNLNSVTTVTANPPANNGLTISAAPRTPWYKNPCVTKAALKGGASALIDGIGLLPGGGAVSAEFSLFKGAAAVSNGTAILGRVQLGAGIITTANGASDSSTVGATQTALGVGGIVLSVAKVTPVAGQIVSGISVGLDLIGMGMNIAQCTRQPVR